MIADRGTSRSKIRRAWGFKGLSAGLGLLFILALAAHGQTPAPSRTRSAPTTRPALRSSKPLRVLFIGNSYTFFNGGLGAIIQQLAAAVPNGRRLEFVEVTRGGQTLEGHWKEGKALAQIRKGGWDVVVLQEQSLRPIVERERMWQYARMFDVEIRKVGARTIFYETWARKNHPEMQGGLCAAYDGIARELNAAVAPAGAAWEKLLKANPAYALHIADLSHPSPAGSYLNACVFYQVLFDKSPQGLPRIIRNAAGKVLISLSEADALLLQRTAAESCGQSLATTDASGKTDR